MNAKERGWTSDATGPAPDFFAGTEISAPGALTVRSLQGEGAAFENIGIEAIIFKY